MLIRTGTTRTPVTLRWSWDHLNSFELDLLAEAIRQDLDLKGSRLAGATLAALVLALFAGFAKYAFTGLTSLYLRYKRNSKASESVRELLMPVSRPCQNGLDDDSARKCGM